MKLRVNIGWMILGNGTFAGFQWLYLVTVARLCGLEDAGAYALCQSVIYPVFAFCNLNLRQLQVTHRGEHVFSIYFRFASLSALAATVVSLIAFSLLIDVEVHGLPLFAPLCAASIVAALSDACYGHMQSKENMQSIAVSLILRNSIAFPIFGAMIYSGLPLWHAAFSIPIVWLSVLLVHDIYAVNERPSILLSLRLFDKRHLGIIRYGLPMGGLIFFNQLYLNSPRLVLEHYSGLAAVGQYAPIASLIALGAFVVNAVTNSALPRLVNLHQANNVNGFYNLSLKLLALACAIGMSGLVVGTLFRQELLSAIFGDLHPGSEEILIIVLTASLFWYLSAASGTCLTATRSFSSQFRISIIVFVATIGACLVAIEKFGAIGAACALALGACVKFTIQTILVIRQHRKRLSRSLAP
ncbi:MAG: O-antigen/teichoic acid export membrane protein [Gammaproteobacteria bacterium]|jgi:O-antigen/teichoic acid export membrane protein